jgi:hypothetical protein
VPRLSCIIPVSASVAALEATLVSVLANRPEDCEILVALRTPYADPYGLGDEVVFLDAPAKSGYIECANRGIQASRGRIVHLLAAGLEVAEGWADAACARFADPTIAAVAPVLRNSETGQVVATGLDYTRGGRPIVRRDAPSQYDRIEVLGPLAAAAFYRRSALESVGGLPAEFGEHLADVDLALALRSVGLRAEVEASSTVFQQPTQDLSARFLRASGFHYGLAAERLFWRNRSSTANISDLAAHAVSAVGQIVRNPSPRAVLGQFAGRIAGLCSRGDHRPRQQKLHELRESLKAQAVTRTVISERAGRIRVDAPHSPLRPAATQDVRVSG